MKEYKIGEKFEIEGVKYVCVEDPKDSDGCNCCDLCEMLRCTKYERSDGLDVHFEKVNP